MKTDGKTDRLTDRETDRQTYSKIDVLIKNIYTFQVSGLG